MECAVLVSGGVDSSVALRLLKQAGEYRLTAFYLKIWLEDEMAYMGECPWEEDLRYVRDVCDAAEVPLEVISLQREYWERVVDHTLTELKAGRTPSPDILCNQRVKFGAFLERVGTQYAKVASGHYAQNMTRDGLTYLTQAVDGFKDQTYFLSHLSQAQAARTLFPIGHLPKADVRRLATDFALPNNQRPDSQGICFLGKIPYNEFVRYHLGDKPGKIVDRDSGKILGDHRGTWFHTIGQRKGLGLSGGPWFVVSKDLSTNTVFVVHDARAAEAATKEIYLEGLNWIATPPTRENLTAKIRHGEHMVPCTFAMLSENTAKIVLENPDRGVAPGQYAVLYDGEVCLGGGVIC